MTLFSTTLEVTKYIKIDVNTHFDPTINAFVEEAQQLFIIDLLGQAMFDTLLTNYTVNKTVGTDDVVDITGMDDFLEALAPYVQRPLAYYAMYLGIEQFGVRLGDAGIQHTRGDNTDPAPKWKVDDLRFHYLNCADRFAEKLLKFLEANADNYPDWRDNPAVNTKAEGLIVPTAAIASEDVDINDSRRVFLRMKKRIRDVEQRHIKRLICQPQYDQLVTEIKADTLTATNIALIDKLKPIISKMALFLTIPSLRLSITENGITIFSSNDSIITKMAASKEEVKHLIHSLKDGELGYKADIDELNQFIEDNISDYPLIESSTCYTSKAVPGPRHVIANDSSNSHFSV